MIKTPSDCLTGAASPPVFRTQAAAGSNLAVLRTALHTADGTNSMRVRGQNT
jgi:hypothetical protein